MVNRGDGEKRKTKNDKRAKARYNKYKIGGKFRGTKIVVSNKRNEKS